MIIGVFPRFHKGWKERFRCTVLYFVWMICIAYTFAIITGTIGWLASFFFVRYIYASIKVCLVVLLFPSQHMGFRWSPEWFFVLFLESPCDAFLLNQLECGQESVFARRKRQFIGQITSLPCVWVGTIPPTCVLVLVFPFRVAAVLQVDWTTTVMHFGSRSFAIALPTPLHQPLLTALWCMSPSRSHFCSLET